MSRRVPKRPVKAIAAWAGTSSHQQDRLPELWPTKNGIPRFQISNSQWKIVERDYGKKLTPAVRAEITATTDEFIAFATAEQAGISTRATREQLKRIKRAAEMLSSVLLAAEEADLTSFHLTRHFDVVEKFPAWLAVLAVACEKADTDLADVTALVEGSAWAQWIRALTGIAEKYGLPTAARKDSDRQVTYVASAFVLLVLALQKQCVPARCHRHASLSYGAALAEAISVARRARRKK